VPVSPLYPPPTACEHHRRRRPFRRAHRRSRHRQLCRRPGGLRHEIYQRLISCFANNKLLRTATVLQTFSPIAQYFGGISRGIATKFIKFLFRVMPAANFLLNCVPPNSVSQKFSPIAQYF
jgi:hypothetical protein